MSEGFKGFTDGPIDGVVIRDLRKFEDSRGWLAELFRHDELETRILSDDGLYFFDQPGRDSWATRARGSGRFVLFHGPLKLQAETVGQPARFGDF